MSEVSMTTSIIDVHTFKEFSLHDVLLIRDSLMKFAWIHVEPKRGEYNPHAFVIQHMVGGFIQLSLHMRANFM